MPYYFYFLFTLAVLVLQTLLEKFFIQIDGVLRYMLMT